MYRVQPVIDDGKAGKVPKREERSRMISGTRFRLHITGELKSQASEHVDISSLASRPAPGRGAPDPRMTRGSRGATSLSSRSGNYTTPPVFASAFTRLLPRFVLFTCLFRALFFICSIFHDSSSFVSSAQGSCSSLSLRLHCVAWLRLRRYGIASRRQCDSCRGTMFSSPPLFIHSIC